MCKPHMKHEERWSLKTVAESDAFNETFCAVLLGLSNIRKKAMQIYDLKKITENHK